MNVFLIPQLLILNAYKNGKQELKKNVYIIKQNIIKLINVEIEIKDIIFLLIILSKIFVLVVMKKDVLNALEQCLRKNV